MAAFTCITIRERLAKYHQRRIIGKISVKEGFRWTPCLQPGPTENSPGLIKVPGFVS